MSPNHEIRWQSDYISLKYIGQAPHKRWCRLGDACRILGWSVNDDVSSKLASDGNGDGVKTRT